jgi:two-component system sensor histidine kinase ResE
MLNDQIIHDLKNPLTTIFGTVDLFLDGTLGQLTGEQKGYLETIHASTQRLMILLAELQFIAKNEKGEASVSKSVFPAEDLLKELSWLKRSAEKSSKTIDLRPDPGLNVTADKDLTLTIISDLLLNAVKQTERGGKVEFNINKINGSYKFEIKAPGEVIPKEFTDKVFDKDFIVDYPKLRTKVSPGSGFYFCKLAVEAQGGKIGIEVNSKGTSFYFLLPA